MTGTLAVGLACVVPVFALLVAWGATGRRWTVSPLLLFVGVSTLFINIGFVVAFLEAPLESHALTALLSVTFGLLLVAVGGAVGAAIFPLPSRPPEIDTGAAGSDLPYPIAMTSALVVFGIVGVYFYLLGYVPLVSGIKLLISEGFVTGLVNTFRLNRDVYFNPEARYIPFQGFMETVRYNGLPIVSIWFLHFYRHGIRKRLSATMLAASVLLIVSTGQRWPLMNMLIVFLVYLSWTETDWTRYRKLFGRIALVGLSLGVVLSALLGRTANRELGWSGLVFFGFADLFDRIVSGNARVPFMSYAVFPDQHAHLMGWSWVQNLIALLPGPMPSFPVTFQQIVTGSSKGFTAPPDFYTEAWVNFGWTGVVALSFLWGVALSAAHSFILRSRPALLRTSVFALMVTILGFSSISGVSFLAGGIIVGSFVFLMTRGQQLLFRPWRVRSGARALAAERSE